MRDLLITIIVLAAVVYAFKRPWAGVMLWTWISVMNPHRLAWGFAFNAPFAAMAAGVTLISVLMSKEPVRLPRNGAVTALILFIVWMVFSTALAIEPGDSFTQLIKVFKIQLMTLVALAVLHEKKHIEIFVWVNALSLAFFGFKGGIHTILTAGGSRVWGPGGFIGGNNEIGLAMLVVIPLLYYLFLQARQRWLRWGLIGLMTLTSIAVLGTQSRGAFVGIVAMALVLWWRAPRKLLSGVLISLAAVVSLGVMSQEFTDRMNTISNYEEDSSAVGRLYAWRTAINIANSRPTGAGFAMYNQRISDRYAARYDFKGKIDAKILEARAAHSIYFQILGEHGWVGLALFMAVWVFTWRTASRLRKRSKGDAELQWVSQLAGMCQVALVGYGVGGAFLSLAYFDLPFNVMVIVVVTERWVAMRKAQQQALGAAPLPAPLAPAGRLMQQRRHGGPTPMIIVKALGGLASSTARARCLSILIFHRVVERADPLFPEEPDAERFDDILRWVRASFNVMPLAQAVNALADGQLPPRAMAITFDDGYADNHDVALPILQRHGLHATFFVADGFLDGGRMWNDTVVESVRRAALGQLDLSGLDLGVHEMGTAQQRRQAIDKLLRQIKYQPSAQRAQTVARIARQVGAALPDDLMMTTAQLRALHAAGMAIGGHTASHPILARLDDEQARLEINSNKARLESLLQSPLTLFAYPNGQPGRDYHAGHAAMVRQAGYRAAVSTASGAARRDADPMQLPRFTPWDAALRFGLRLVHNMRRPGRLAA